MISFKLKFTFSFFTAGVELAQKRLNVSSSLSNSSKSPSSNSVSSFGKKMSSIEAASSGFLFFLRCFRLFAILAAMLTDPLTGVAFLAWREGELGGTGSAVVDVAVVFVAAAEVPRPTDTERCCVVTAGDSLV